MFIIISAVFAYWLLFVLAAFLILREDKDKEPLGGEHERLL